MNEPTGFAAVIAWMSENAFRVLLSMLAIVFVLNLFPDIMEIDAAQYAEISREMYRSHSYLEVYLRHADYLDKPPLLFWLSSLSFSIFGISNFAYKLPGLLVLVLGMYSLYRFALLWYDKQRAEIAVLIFGTTQAVLLMTNDVRTDAFLTGFVMFSVWQLSAYLKKRTMVNLFLAAVGIAGGMLAKGPVGLILPAFGVGGHLLLTRNWKAIFRPQWLLMLAIVGLLLIPMCIGLYYQYDVHPEKEVYGLHGPSGLKFFFWTQSFGRITGDIYWDNGATFFYFFHTILWDLQPWVLIFVAALLVQLVAVLRRSNFIQPEFFSLSAFVLGFLALSTSHYKLPHYIFPLFPFAAVISAHFLVRISQLGPGILKFFAAWQTILSLLFFAVVFVAYFFVFSPLSWIQPAITIVLLIAALLILRGVKMRLKRLIYITVIGIVAFGFNSSTYLYPQLLRYQAPTQAGKYFKENRIPEKDSYVFASYGYSLDFYADRITKDVTESEFASLPVHSFIYTDSAGMRAIQNAEPGFKVKKVFLHHHATSLTLPFLFRKSRPSTLEKRYLLEKQ